MSGTSAETPTDVAMASVPEHSIDNNDSLVWGGSLYYNPRKKRPHKVGLTHISNVFDLGFSIHVLILLLSREHRSSCHIHAEWE